MILLGGRCEANHVTHRYNYIAVVKQENYTVFDYSQEALDQGIQDFPDTDFRMWNHHNQMNNPDGNINEALPFVGDEKFDFKLFDFWAHSPRLICR